MMGGIVGAVFLLFVFIVLAIIGAGLLMAAMISFMRRKVALPIILLIVGSICMAPFLLVQIKNAEIRKKGFNVETSLPLDTVGYKLHPDVFINKTGDDIRQSVWGEVRLNIVLPRGGTIKGTSNRISLTTDASGKLESLQVFYEPDMAFYHARSVGDVFKYWKSQGTVVFDYPGSFKVDSGPYALEIGEIGGYITFVLTTDKKD